MRAYRLPWPNGITIYELDHAELLDIKGRLLTGQSLAPKCKRVLIGSDLRQGWAQLLADSGFAPSEPSVSLIEGLFYYLDEPAVNHVLKEVSGLAAPRSLLITDLVGQSLLSNPWMQQALKAMGERGMGWRFGTDDPVSLFAQLGWEAEVKQPAEEGAKYNPQRFPNKSGQSMMSFFVVARRTRSRRGDKLVVVQTGFRLIDVIQLTAPQNFLNPFCFATALPQ